MSTSVKKIAFKFSVLTICLAQANVSLAEEESTTPAYAGIERIEVSAQKRMQSINEVGITMNAFTGDSIKEWGVATSEDIAIFTPGLTVNSGGGTGIPVYTIRGVGFQDSTTTSNSSTVGLYFDEVSVPYAIMTRGALFDVERVEVLKGPQGDLYGRNTTAGQINYISNKPTDDFELGTTVSYGSFQTLDVEGYISGALADSVQGRFAFKTTQSNEGWQRSLTRPNDTLGEKDVTAMRAMVNFDLTDDATLLLRIHHVDDQSDNQAPTAYDGKEIGLNSFGAPYLPIDQYVLPDGEHFGETPPWYSIGDNRVADWTNDYTHSKTGEKANLRPRRDNQLTGISAKIEWDFNDLTFTSITGYDDFSRNESNDIAGVHSVVQNTINESDIKVFSQELRLNASADNYTWIAGLYYSNDEAEEFYNFFMEDSIFGKASARFNLPAPFTVFPIYRLHTRYQQEAESSAIFGHLEYQLSDDLQLTVGARYTKETRQWSGCTFDAGDGSLVGLWNGAFGANLAPGACATLDDSAGSATNIANVIATENINDAFHVYKTQVSTNKWMGKVSLDYHLNDNALVYATYSNGFKSGGFNGNNSNTTTQLEPYKPEELDAIEVGFKSTLLDNTMQINASIFNYDYKNKQETEKTITPVGAISGLGNVPKSVINGAELELTWAPLQGLVVKTGAAYLDTEIKEWQTPVSGVFDFATGQAIDVVYTDGANRNLPNSPQWSYNALVSYEWQLTGDYIMDISGDINYTDDQVNDIKPQNSLEAFTVANLRLGLSDNSDTWRIMLWARNITDEYYYVGAFGGVNGGYARRVGMPKTFGISVDYKFY